MRKTKVTAIFTTLAFMSSSVFAQSSESASDVFQRLTGEVNSAMPLLLTVATIAGIFFLIAAGFMWMKDQKQQNQGHAKTAVMNLVVGVFLLSVTSVAYIATNSILGSSEEAQSAISSGAQY